MNNSREIALDLIDFAYNSPTAFHAVENVKDRLNKEGFIELKEENKWSLVPKGKYYVTKNNSAIVAFKVGNGDVAEHGFKLVGAHTDSPGFRIKPNPDIVVENAYVKLNTEVYGGPILNTWFDRPLALAGRVTLEGDKPLYPVSKLVNIKRPILVIPNLAIHMNREVNDGFKINRQKDTLPLLSLINEKLEKGNYLLELLAKELNVSKEAIIDLLED